MAERRLVGKGRFGRVGNKVGKQWVCELSKRFMENNWRVEGKSKCNEEILSSVIHFSFKINV